MWRSTDLVFLKFEKCEDKGDTSIDNEDQEGVKC